ncbi:chorismate synthase [Bifidobacterium sp.]|jgi:chorismate synthase|uniref:chorismate synthase n=1 Tax=Bifidobacterium sp. TaxID=41200 RepID=UPI0025BDF078|nr:chorismate synthase [Bifidobacterium sp.]MCH4161094.1 chorismate synthase [Bifidobacterium sp.]MCH4174428.1 chorismate synthase [Bifidobacterium sp.]MCI1635837.1 chorismate synthase [Bifidobacterium sp.]
MLRWQTAGESHGEALVAMIEGLPSGIEITTEDIAEALARRRLGHGRGARMKFEKDKVRLLTGVRHGKTLGSPVSIEIGNTEWPKWVQVMSADPLPEGVELPTTGRNAPLSRPRPGHADLTGMRKYGFLDSRPVLERSSARETASRVALGEIAGHFLEQVAGIRVISHVLSIGGVGASEDYVLPTPEDVQRLDASPVRSLDPEAEQRMIERIDEAQKAGDTLGGVIEVIAYGVPAGLGTYVESDRRLDAALASAFMGIQAIKGVEIGDGFLEAQRPGSQAHDEIVPDAEGHIARQTNRAGGIEGGMSNGEAIRVRAAMKPISSVPRALKTVDVLTGEAATAIHQRSDITAVPAAGVVAEAMMRLTLASFVIEKFGGDSIEETSRNAQQYVASWPEHLR